MTHAALLGVAAAAFQTLAYFIYAFQVVRSECRPNGMPWLMWSYGTLVLLPIEWYVGAPLSILMLPGVCSLRSPFVSGCAFVRGAWIVPDRQDRAIPGLDMAIPAGYVLVLYGPEKRLARISPPARFSSCRRGPRR